ncbi:hypothetical protein F5Y16DRAFT_151088 [Xylariaceae sp. FL0255]|nr:hypothetical protein F5Y16DRAFT_151088 [Xylariaceae sp. FL0255]
MTLNPLAIPAILLSAYTICAYTYRLHTCPKCTGSPPVDIVNIFEAPPHCQRLSRWKAEGVGIANWGTDNFIMLEVCHCGLGKIVDWFRALLAPRDKQAEASLMVFLDELQRDCW